MSDKPKLDPEPRRDSERALAIDAERAREKAEADRINAERRAAVKRTADRASIAILTDVLPDLDPEDQDSAVTNLADVMPQDEIDRIRKQVAGYRQGPPSVATKPPITKPTPEALRDSRRESTIQPPVTLPSPPPKMTPPEGYKLPAPAHETAPPPSAPRIVVVDDDPDILDSLGELLTERGYRICKARDGGDAIMCLAQMVAVDLILLDVMMAPIDGATFLRWLAKPDNAWHMTPVLVISAGEPSGALYDEHSLFARKPFDVPALLATIQRMIESHRGRL